MGWFPGWKTDSAASTPPLSPNGSSHHSKHNNAELDEDDTDAMLTQFPPYGSSRPANQDWMLLGYPTAAADSLTTPPPVMAADNDETLDETARLNAPSHFNNQPLLTTGSGSPTAVTAASNAPAFLDWDTTEQGLWKNEQKAIATANPLTVLPRGAPQGATTTHTTAQPWRLVTSNARTAGTVPSSTSSTVNPVLKADRQHWMPDQYCNTCYACDAPFTVFRRRHHCRVCGQVFCNPCSAYFLPMEAPARYSHRTDDGLLESSGPYSTPSVQSNVATTTVRVCHACHQQVQQQQHLAKQQLAQQTSPSTPTMGKTAPLRKSLSKAPSSPTMAAASTTNSHRPTPINTTPHEHQSGASNATASQSPYLPTPKTQNVIEESLLQQQQQEQPSTVQAQQSQPSTMDSMWQSFSQKSLLFLPELHGMAVAAASKNTRNTVEEEEDGDISESEAGTTTTTNLIARPSWFPLQRGTSSNASTIPAASNSSNNVASPEAETIESVGANDVVESTAASEVLADPAPPQTDVVRAAEASVKSAAAKEGRRHLGLAAANHLRALCQNLLNEYAPKLEPESHEQWQHHLLTLATRCCATVEPNVKNGDLIDIRPYCKIKTISGGDVDDCAYLSGVVFTKSVAHKDMAKELINPRIMLLNGGIEFTRHENQIASLETLFEQEQKYTEILVGKILKLKPDILMVGRYVSRQAHELLLAAGVVLIQQVKASLLTRIARQTGATIISSTDHIMNQFGADALGKCHRFRLVTFRDNEIWSDKTDAGHRSIPTLLATSTLKNYERQAALAADKLGESVIDGAEAVRSGLAKRGVAQTYVMLEGCPKELGCTIVLRGADRAALKEVKAVLRFLIMTAYNLRLETCYLKERCARLRPDFVETPDFALSTSLCVDFGYPPDGRNSRPWNGGTAEPPPSSKTGIVTAFDHQSILITSVWMTQKSQCCPAEVKGICYYSLQDVTLGQFLRDSCFNLSLKCQNPNCKKSVLDHSLSFVHNDGLLNILVEEMEEELPPAPHQDKADANSDSDVQDQTDEEGVEPDRPIATWTYCRKCQKLVAPLTYISERTWRFSFGKFLESFFYNRDAIMNTSEEVGCSCDLQKSAILFFGCGKLAARFSYETVRPYGVFARRFLPIEMSYHKEEALRKLDIILRASSELFVRFDKHIDRVSREARSLLQSAVNRPEHVQTVFSELNQIGAEVDHVARVLQEKVASVIEEYRRRKDSAVSEALMRFPWIARRYLFMLTSAWNEKLSAAGQAITAMRKIASATSSRNEGIGPAVVGDIYNEELLDSMNRLRLLKERFSSYNVTDINQALPSLHSGEYYQPDEYDDDFEEAESSIDFTDGVDADVMASRRRLQGGKAPLDRRTRTVPNKSLGSMRAGNEAVRGNEQDASASVAPKNTPGGAVKSALNRFFNRGGRDQDYYVVDLGMFAEGRPRLEPGVNGVVRPVFDEQWSSIIAYSLSSTDYASQLKHYAKFETTGTESSSGGDPINTPYGGVPKGAPADVQRDSGRSVERRMLIRNKTHIKHTFRDFDEKGQVTCKFVCTSYWATQFQAVREVFLSPKPEGDESNTSSGSDIEQSYIESLSSAATWAASGGKSGASFSRTSDHRFVIKCISRTELQMFLDCAPAYFEYLSKAFFHGLPTVLCKIVGVYQVRPFLRPRSSHLLFVVCLFACLLHNKD